MLRVGARMRFAAVVLLTLASGSVSSKAKAADNQLCDLAADFALGREDYRTAIILHRRLLQSQPNNALAHYHLGFAYGTLGRAPEELSEYLTSARLGLKNWDLFVNWGLAYLGQHKLVRATEAFETAVSLGTEHAETHLNLAVVYERQNRLGEALREITVARHLTPYDPEAANTNAIICIEIGDRIRAHNIWAHLVQRAPDYTPARANLSILNRYLASNGQLERHTEFSYSDPEVSACRAVRSRDFASSATSTCR